MAELSIAQKKDWAKLLYAKDELTQKDIAKKVGVSERTMSKWATDGEWELERQSMLTSKTEILRHLYATLSRLSKKLKDAEKEADAKTADMFVKFSTTINNLETEASASDISEVGRIIIEKLQKTNPEIVLDVLYCIDGIIKEKLKKQ